LRRVVLILLALVLVPSIAAATTYQCTFDHVVRSACCCRAEAHKQPKAPSRDTTIKAACCCTVTHLTSTTASRLAPTAHVAVAPPAVAVAIETPPAAPPTRVARIDRPRAQGDPGTRLFVRHCSLLL
jgi:hypothetical protein